MKPCVLIGSVLAAITTVFSLQVFGETPTKIEKDKGAIEYQLNDKPIKNPDDTTIKLAEPKYKANKDSVKEKTKKADELPSFVTDEEVQKKGGHYVLKQQMTYEEYYGLGITKNLRYDIDPDRLVWIFQIKYKEFIIEETMINDAIVTTVFDTETGDPIEMMVTSENKSEKDKLKSIKK